MIYICHNLDGPQGCYAERKKHLISKYETLHYSLILHPQNVKSIMMENRSEVARVRVGVGYNYKWLAQRTFLEVICILIMVPVR